MLIKRITDNDIFGGTPELVNIISRYGSRGVLIDTNFNIAMMHMTTIDLLKLPGGGLEAGESGEDAFLREIKEETGYNAEVTYKLGYIEEHKSKNNFLQLSYCYIALASSRTGEINLSESELQLGMAVKWMTLTEALQSIRESFISCSDYSTKFMLLRDMTILEFASDIIKKEKILDFEG
jgi:8-oxo-dGTP diphosphatase